MGSQDIRPHLVHVLRCLAFAVVIRLLETGTEVKISRSSITFYAICQNEEELTEVIEELTKAGFLKKGSLILTYKGITYLVGESLLLLLEEGEQLEDEEIEVTNLRISAEIIKSEPYNAVNLYTLLSSITSFLINLPRTKLDSEKIAAMTSFLTNVLSSLIIAATNDSDMRGLIRQGGTSD
jgi:hypothetical protein